MVLVVRIAPLLIRAAGDRVRNGSDIVDVMDLMVATDLRDVGP